ncbi:hypothetical protein [Actinoplanes sp. NPDC051859]|uniref:hypothetical protein n=1 Tax=Actinoplanes sp. NPDC051859 TaxID=3363909 RepID=UPI0037970CDA
MTSTPPPQPGPDRPVLPVIRPLRDLAAYALVAAPAVWLFVAVIRLVPSGVGQDFLTRAQSSFYSYVNVETVFFPLAAVLLATLVQPRHRHARLITIVALAEYAVAAFFGVLFGFLIAIVKLAGFSPRVAFEELLVRVAWLAVLALAGFAVFSIWRALYQVARPTPQPGMYGQPQQPWGQPQPGQPFASQPFASQPQPGQPQPGQPYPGQPVSGQPYPGQPVSGQPHPGQPVSGQPHPGQAQGGQPHPGQPSYAGQPHPGPAQPAWGQPTAVWGESVAPPASAPSASTSPVVTPPPAPAVTTASGTAPAPAATPPGPFVPAPGHPHGEQTTGSHGEPTQVVRDGDEPTRVVGEDPQRGV